MGKNWAIVVGINNYDNLQPLKYAKRDAEAMQAWFKDEANFDQVFLFTEDSPSIPTNPPIPTQPTQGRFKRFLNAQFDEPLLKPEDNLWFFFAGHGKRFIDQDYLMFLDSDPTDYTTAISVDYVTQRLRRCGADNVVLLIDACRDEGDRSGLGVGLQEHKGVITFYSCAANQKSWEIDELQHGSFTYSLLEGLQLQGESNCATVERLEQHLRYRVPQLNNYYNKPIQNPRFKAEPPYKMYYILLEQAARIKDVEPLKYQASLAENEGDLLLAEQLWIRVLSVSRVDRDAIRAIQRIAQRQVPPVKPISEILSITQPVALPTGERGVIFEPAFKSKNNLKVFQFDVITVNAQGEKIKIEQSQAEYFIENLGNGITLEMVLIPGGSFLMGSPESDPEHFDSEKPQHPVTIKQFYMGRYPITQAQWKAVASFPKIEINLNSEPSYFKGVNRPVENINWYEANEFCERLSRHAEHEYRLPSEAEWEYTCRAGTVTPFHFGDTLTSELANYIDSQTYHTSEKGKYIGKTTSVMNYSANSFGIYDMHGNVREWCFDYWHSNYQGAPSDGTVWKKDGNQSFRVLRGGSWLLNIEDCRSAHRHKDVPSNKSQTNGFRVVCS